MPLRLALAASGIHPGPDVLGRLRATLPQPGFFETAGARSCALNRLCIKRTMDADDQGTARLSEFKSVGGRAVERAAAATPEGTPLSTTVSGSWWTVPTAMVWQGGLPRMTLLDAALEDGMLTVSRP